MLYDKDIREPLFDFLVRCTEKYVFWKKNR